MAQFPLMLGRKLSLLAIEPQRNVTPDEPPFCAAICLAHHGDPSGVRRLAAYFAAAGAVLFVHVDARTAINPYEHALAGLPRVILLGQRQRVFWGGFSLVTAPLEAIRAARARGAPSPVFASSARIPRRCCPPRCLPG